MAGDNEGKLTGLRTPSIGYKPFRYPWAYEFWRRQQQVHWMPEEVPLGEDVKDWAPTVFDTNSPLSVEIVLASYKVENASELALLAMVPVLELDPPCRPAVESDPDAKDCVRVTDVPSGADRSLTLTGELFELEASLRNCPQPEPEHGTAAVRGEAAADPPPPPPPHPASSAAAAAAILRPAARASRCPTIASNVIFALIPSPTGYRQKAEHVPSAVGGGTDRLGHSQCAERNMSVRETSKRGGMPAIRIRNSNASLMTWRGSHGLNGIDGRTR